VLPLTRLEFLERGSFSLTEKPQSAMAGVYFLSLLNFSIVADRLNRCISSQLRWIIQLLLVFFIDAIFYAPFLDISIPVDTFYILSENI
jgi:hypothetical protein